MPRFTITPTTNAISLTVRLIAPAAPPPWPSGSRLPAEAGRLRPRRVNRRQVAIRLTAPFRRIATRYDKLADNFLAMVKLASMRLWLRAYESTA